MALNFIGGVFLKEDMYIKNLPLAKADAPAFVLLPLIEDAKPIVSLGDQVMQGTTIAINADGFRIFSTISGTVTQMQDLYIKIENDYKYRKQQIFKPLDRPLDNLSFEEFIFLVKNSGIVGSYSGVPTYKKIKAAENKVHRVIINCIESDPDCGFTNDFIIQNAKEIILGTKLLMHFIGVKKAILAIDINASQAESELYKHINDKSMMVTAQLRPKYPQGYERMIITSVYNIETQLTKPIEDSGYSVFSCETVANIYKCLHNGENVMFKALSVTGLAEKKNLYAYIGTPINELFAECDAYRKGEAHLSSGGIMCGRRVSGEMPVTANTNLLRADLPLVKDKGKCIHCGRCMEICPVALVPYRLREFFRSKQIDKCINEGVFNCFECGACSYICPGSVDLLGDIRKAKRSRFVYLEPDFDEQPQTEEIVDTQEQIIQEEIQEIIEEPTQTEEVDDEQEA